MDVKKIYFDMDGVLADFNRGVVELLNLPVVEQGKKTKEQDDILFAAMRDYGHYYNDLLPCDGAGELFDEVYSKYGDKCEILTGIPKPRREIYTAKDDKIAWTRRLLSENIVINTVYREEKKKYCMGPEYILIDDYQINIDEWELMGGTGILHIDAESTIKKLKELKIL